ncbi:Arc family DNA-binding protein [Xenorhabdus eapokensis]|uniref:Arc-like DNA binding domain-containing protein n=1 Tax=Xenorhabdus eapokensis TaxID=1873482 RepID=A0A1Q5TQY1_9GAMM|nr:Arc family DNA-binding protein [Xenorhabdus eapokensis]OKP02620.1 hypothetical protein Xedl_02271 [Xenorhabdus eapokensis]
MSKKLVAAQDKFMLRLPDGMREAIAESAKQNGRSMNSEIIAALETWLDPEKQALPVDREAEFKSIIDRNNEALEQLLEMYEKFITVDKKSP